MSRTPESEDGLSLGGFRAVVSTLVSQVERLQMEVAAQARGIEDQSRTIEEQYQAIEDLKVAVSVRDTKIGEQAEEIARLKGLPPRPKFPGKPSGMEKATSKPLGGKGKVGYGAGQSGDPTFSTAMIMRGCRVQRSAC